MNDLSIHSAVEGSDNWCEDLAVAHAQSMDERMACRSVLSFNLTGRGNGASKT